MEWISTYAILKWNTVLINSFIHSSLWPTKPLLQKVVTHGPEKLKVYLTMKVATLESYYSKSSIINWSTFPIPIIQSPILFWMKVQYDEQWDNLWIFCWGSSHDGCHLPWNLLQYHQVIFKECLKTRDILILIVRRGIWIIMN